MTRKLGLAIGGTLVAMAAAPLIHGVALADDYDHSDINKYHNDFKRAHQGGHGARGGRNHSECLVPLGLSLGAIASSGGTVNQCNARGGDGGNGGAGDVDY